MKQFISLHQSIPINPINSINSRNP